ncbi:hypothetical protein AAG906_020353 [Vitis piasezkii]
MDQHRITKRRRVYSLQPNTLPRTVFAKKYVSHLVPALMDIGNKPDSDQREDHELEKLVRYEVDKALVSSAEGFAWSRALNVKLQRGGLNVGRLQNSSITPQTQRHRFRPNSLQTLMPNLVRRTRKGLKDYSVYRNQREERGRKAKRCNLGSS